MDQKIWKKRTGKAYTSIEDYVLRVTGQTKEALLHPKKTPSATIEGLPQAAAAIERAIENKRPITIVGDYDADGITATAILVLLLKHLGASPKTIIPRRFSNGYGISESIVKDIRGELILCVDNGVVALDAVDAAKKADNTVVILDHHLPADRLPNADVIVDPHIHPEKNGFTDYCGAGLALKLAEYYLPLPSEHRTLFYNMTALACIGTVADVMPLIGDNRRIIKEGLAIINNDKGFASLTSGIKDLVTLAGRPCTEETIGFRLAPMINAAGRLYDAGGKSTLKCLLEEDISRAGEYSEKLRAINEMRKDLVDKWYKQYLKQAAPEDKVQIIMIPDAPEGIMGIIASKLMEAFHVPAFAFTTTSREPGILKGSGRTYGTFDLSLLFDHIRCFCERLGGHAGAAGISVKESAFGEMKKAALSFMETLDMDDSWRYDFYDIEVAESGIPEAYAQLKQYAPWGEGIRKPVLRVSGVKLQKRYGEFYRLIGANRDHLRLNGALFDSVGFHLAETYLNIGCPEVVDLLGTVGENTYNGITSIQFSIASVQAGENSVY